MKYFHNVVLFNEQITAIFFNYTGRPSSPDEEPPFYPNHLPNDFWTQMEIVLSIAFDSICDDIHQFLSRPVEQ